MYFLTKTDEARNVDRVYGIVVGASLYGSHCVMRFSGRRGQYTRVWPPIVCADEAEAERQGADCCGRSWPKDTARIKKRG